MRVQKFSELPISTNTDAFWYAGYDLSTGLNSRIAASASGGGGGNFLEAPIDEFQYTRGQGQWNKLDNSSYLTVAEATSRYIPFTGGTYTGSVFLSKNPESPMEAATKEYVDISSVNTFHEFDSAVFNDETTTNFVSLKPNSIGTNYISSIEQSKIIGLESSLSNKSGKLLAGSGISLVPSPDGSILVSSESSVFIVTQTRPSIGVVDKIYWIPDDNGYYDQWIYENNAWSYVGKTSGGVDLSDFYTKTNVDTLLSEKVNISTLNTELNKKADRSFVDTKVTQTVLASRVHATSSVGVPTTIAYSIGAESSKIAQRDVSGNISVISNVPVTTNNAIGAKQVNDNYAGKSGTQNISGGWNFDLAPRLSPDSTDTPISNSLITKKYVDDKIAAIQPAVPVSAYSVRKYEITSLFEIPANTSHMIKCYIESTGDQFDSVVSIRQIPLESNPQPVSIKAPIGFGSSRSLSVNRVGQSYTVREEIGSQKSIITLSNTDPIEIFYKVNDEGDQTTSSFAILDTGEFLSFDVDNTNLSDLSNGQIDTNYVTINYRQIIKRTIIGINFGQNYSFTTALPQNFLSNFTKLQRVGLKWFNNVVSMGANAFYNIPSISAVSFRGFSPNLKITTSNIFLGATNLSQIDFGSLPASAFDGAINLFINVGITAYNKDRYHTTQGLANSYTNHPIIGPIISPYTINILP
jgi:hypothetical protein